MPVLVDAVISTTADTHCTTPATRVPIRRPNLERTLQDLLIEVGEELVVTDPVFTREASLLLEIHFV